MKISPQNKKKEEENYKEKEKRTEITRCQELETQSNFLILYIKWINGKDADV